MARIHILMQSKDRKHDVTLQGDATKEKLGAMTSIAGNAVTLATYLQQT